MNDLENKLKERNARMFADQSKEVRIGITQLMEEIDEILEMWKKEVENREIRLVTLSSAESTHIQATPPYTRPLFGHGGNASAQAVLL